MGKGENPIYKGAISAKGAIVVGTIAKNIDNSRIK